MIPLETCAAVFSVSLLIAVGLAIVFVRRGRRVACPNCGARLPRNALICPSCGLQLAKGPSPTIAEPTPAQPSSVELVITQGPLAPRRLAIPTEGLTIGRQPDNDLVLADEMMVSRHHAVIVPEQGQHVLYDKDSANGTWVNEQRVFRHVLVPGDRIQIWQSQFVFALPGASPPPPAPAAPRAPMAHVVGECFDGYRLESLIGRGGMSDVFKGRDPNGQPVAIKILHESNPYLVAKFVQEGNQIGPILRGHPNIVYVHHFGQSQDGRLYLVMEYVEAPPLRKLLIRPLQGPEITNIIGQVCSALAFAHQNNIVHRDIKPENILVTHEGLAKVLDFGIAKLTSAATVTTDAIIGTPEYISPEQARGEPVQPASDVYSLGVVLYEILTGSVPFRRPRTEDPHKAAIEVIRQHLHDRPEPIRKRNPHVEVPAPLERVTMRALEKNMKNRYATAGEMGQALGYRGGLAATQEPSRHGTACLTIVQGPRQGQRLPLAGTGLQLGRAQLGSSNPGISREHSNIILRGGTYWLQDVSKNGTWVNRQRVYGEIPLATGAIITIGDNVLRLDRQ